MNRSWTRKILTVGIIGIGVALAAAFAARAHQGHRHDALGTVKAVDEEGLVLTTTEEQDLRFSFTDETVVKRGAEEVERSDIRAGERAVVTYEAEKDGNHAVEIKLGKKS